MLAKELRKLVKCELSELGHKFLGLSGCCFVFPGTLCHQRKRSGTIRQVVSVIRFERNEHSTFASLLLLSTCCSFSSRLGTAKISCNNQFKIYSLLHNLCMICFCFVCMYQMKRENSVPDVNEVS